jgi:hypothetical protein
LPVRPYSLVPSVRSKALHETYIFRSPAPAPGTVARRAYGAHRISHSRRACISDLCSWIRSCLFAVIPSITELHNARADGRPLLVLLGSDPTRTIRQRVTERMSTAIEDEKRDMAFAALAAPLNHARWSRYLKNALKPQRCAELHDDRSLDEVKKRMPPLRPEPLADAILMRWANEQDKDDWEDLCEMAMDANPILGRSCQILGHTSSRVKGEGHSGASC